MSGNLIIPRVEVYWGDVNLTSYDGKMGDGVDRGEPLVYKVECNLPFQSENPSGTMMWSPTAGAYKIYERLLNEKPDDQIVTTFGYLGLKKVSFVWIWGGNHYTYGNRMELKVELLSELSGLINATNLSFAQAQDQSVNMFTAIQKTEQLFQVEKFKLIKYTDVALQDVKATQVQNSYGKDMVFATAINSIIRENGNYVFSTNIISEAASSPTTPITGRTETASKLVIFTPFQYEGKEKTVEDGQARKYDEYPNPLIRYGYLLGPSMINEMERNYKWEPPQQLNIPTALKKPIPSQNQTRRAGRQSRGTPAQTQQDKSKGGSTTGSQKTGASQGSPTNRRHVTVKVDPVGPQKQILIQQEATAKLSLKTFLVPALVGIKPYDIIYIPSLKATTVNEIEDWIVTQVSYAQTDGGVEVSISANRPYGLEGTLMNIKSGDPFLQKARTLQTLEDWEKYAWCIDSKKPAQVEAATTNPNTGVPQPPVATAKDLSKWPPGYTLTPQTVADIQKENANIGSKFVSLTDKSTQIVNAPNFVRWLQFKQLPIDLNKDGSAIAPTNKRNVENVYGYYWQSFQTAKKDQNIR